MKRLKFKTKACNARKVKTHVSQALTIVPGLKLPPLDEDFDEDQLAFLMAQRICHAAIVDDCLVFKYSDGRKMRFTQGMCQHWGKLYEIERIINAGH